MLQERSASQPQKAQKIAPLHNQAQQSPTDLWEDGQDLNGLDYQVEPSHTAPTLPPAHMDTTSTANLHRTSKPAADALRIAPTPTPPPAHMDRTSEPVADALPSAPTPTPPPAQMARTSKPAGDALPTAADPKAHTPFTDIGDGKYHVKDGLMIGSKQAETILGHKKPSLVVKDMAQAIWGREGLAERSYGGKLAPKDYKNPKAVVRKQLSPHKVALIIDTVTHWGSRSGVPVKETLDNLSEYRNRKALIPTIAVVTSIQLSWHVDFPPTNTAFRRHRGFRVTSDSATADLDHSVTPPVLQKKGLSLPALHLAAAAVASRNAAKPYFSGFAALLRAPPLSPRAFARSALFRVNMSQTQKLLQEFYEEDEATLASYRKRAAREHLQRLAKEANDKAVRDFQLQKQQRNSH
ncbi:hypothetical protein MTO96_044771 [Rhipicephalus appendiculatus]